MLLPVPVRSNGFENQWEVNSMTTRSVSVVRKKAKSVILGLFFALFSVLVAKFFSTLALAQVPDRRMPDQMPNFSDGSQVVGLYQIAEVQEGSPRRGLEPKCSGERVDFMCGRYAYLVKSSDGRKATLMTYSEVLNKVHRALLIGSGSSSEEQCMKNAPWSKVRSGLFGSGFCHAVSVGQEIESNLPEHVQGRFDWQSERVYIGKAPESAHLLGLTPLTFGIGNRQQFIRLPKNQEIPKEFVYEQYSTGRLLGVRGNWSSVYIFKRVD